MSLGKVLKKVFTKSFRLGIILSFAPQFFVISPGKVLKQNGGWVFVTLIESANEMLSIEYNIVVFTSVFYQKKIFFVNLAFHFFLKKNLPFGVGAGI